MSLKDYTALQAEIDTLSAQKAQIKAQTIVEIRATMAAMDIDESELVDAKKFPGVVGPNGETWHGRGRKPLWLLAMEGKSDAVAESVTPAPECAADRLCKPTTTTANLILPA